VHVGLDAPVVAYVLEGRVLVEEAAVPTAHLVVRQLAGVLHAVLLEDLGRLVKDLIVYPRRGVPVLGGDDL
jgi:hypothetical protein